MKRLIQSVVTFGLLLPASAVEVTVQEAGRAVDNWLGTGPALGCPLGRAACDFRTCQSPDGARFHVVRLEGGESLAASTGANGRPVWESYLLGLDPTNPQSDLRITCFEVKDGLPSLGWNVTNESIRDLGYDYFIRGKTRLGDPWRALDAAHRFFRLVVEKRAVKSTFQFSRPN